MIYSFIAKPWDIVDYGVCDIEDILNEIPKNTIVVTIINGRDKMIAIPKREQTEEEIKRTKRFAIEVIKSIIKYYKKLINMYILIYY